MWASPFRRVLTKPIGRYFTPRVLVQGLIYPRRHLASTQVRYALIKRPPKKLGNDRSRATAVAKVVGSEGKEMFKIWPKLPLDELSSRKIKLLILDATQGKEGFQLLRTLLDKNQHKKLRLEGVGPTELNLRFLLIFVGDTCLCVDTLGVMGNGKLCPLDLKRLLMNPRVVKVGSSVEAVVSRLHHDYGLRCGPVDSKHQMENDYRDIMDHLSAKYDIKLKPVCGLPSVLTQEEVQVPESAPYSKIDLQTATKVIQLDPTGMERPKLETMVTDISQLNLRTFSELETVDIYVVENLVELEQSLRYLHKRQQMSRKFYVGFDTEGCSFQDKVGMIQIAFEDVCLLVRIHQIMNQVGEFPEILRDFLEDEQIIKVGVNLSGDVRSLDTVYGLKCKGNLDIDRLVDSRSDAGSSLAELTERYVEQFTLDKTHKKRTWFEQHLDQQDILYAAKDAVAGYVIYEKIKSTVSDTKFRDQLKGISKYRNLRIKIKR